jgi:hypothetical protein
MAGQHSHSMQQDKSLAEASILAYARVEVKQFSMVALCQTLDSLSVKVSGCVLLEGVNAQRPWLLF